MAASTLLTSDQFLALPEEFDQYGNVVHRELINGEVVTMSHAAKRHDIIRGRILQELNAYLLHHKKEDSLLVLPDAEFVISNNDNFIPDVSLIAISRLIGDEKYIQGAPELAVEVVSPSESAAYLRIKTEAYLANGSQSVWIVFPEVRSVMVYNRDSLRELKGDQTITDPLLPGFSCPVAAFFKFT